MNLNIKKILLVIFPFVFIVFFYIIRSQNWEQYTDLTKEDSYIEYFQAATYFAAAGITLFALISMRNLSWFQKICMIFFSLSILVIALEEISWGQRLLEIETPEYFLENNVQYEVSIHNLKPVQSILHQVYIAIGLLGALILPIIRRYLPEKSFVRLVLPTFLTTTYFGSVAIFYLLLDYVAPTSETISEYIKWQDQEVLETLLALGIFITVVKFYLSLRNRKLTK